jgi:hypothetical protein
MRTGKRQNDISIVEGSDNVFADLALPDTIRVRESMR